MRYSLTFLFILLSTNSYSIFGQLGGRIGQKIAGQDINGGIDISGVEDVFWFFVWLTGIAFCVGLVIHFMHSKEIMGDEEHQYPKIKKFADRCITFSFFSLIFTCILYIFV